jgi:formate dehydrogenase major subunit
MPKVTIDGAIHDVAPGELLIDVINRTGGKVPQVCYHPQLGPLQTCDTCMVDVDGRLVRACATAVSAELTVHTHSAAASAAQREAWHGARRALRSPSCGFFRTGTLPTAILVVDY